MLIIGGRFKNPAEEGLAKDPQGAGQKCSYLTPQVVVAKISSTPHIPLPTCACIYAEDNNKWNTVLCSYFTEAVNF